MRFIVVCYDIENDRRRNKIHKTLKDYGKRVQFSVFECLVSEAEFQKLRQRLQALLDAEHPTDQIRYYILQSADVLNIIIDGNASLDLGNDFFVS
jgi:CRISPR-associated protein Cas2